jgi:hypothetical protein
MDKPIKPKKKKPSFAKIFDKKEGKGNPPVTVEVDASVVEPVVTSQPVEWNNYPKITAKALAVSLENLVNGMNFLYGKSKGVADKDKAIMTLRIKTAREQIAILQSLPPGT